MCKTWECEWSLILIFFVHKVSCYGKLCFFIHHQIGPNLQLKETCTNKLQRKLNVRRYIFFSKNVVDLLWKINLLVTVLSKWKIIVHYPHSHNLWSMMWHIATLVQVLIKKIPNTSSGSLSFKFVSDRSFKFLRFQIDPLSFEFVSDRSFKFIRFQIGPLSFEFVSDRSFLSTSVKPKLKDLCET